MTQNFPKFGTPLKGPLTDRDEIDLGALVMTLWRGKWVVALAMFLSVLAGGYYAYVVATPLYQSSAVVMLETQPEQVIDLESVVGGLSGDTSVVNSEVEVLRSRGLLTKVVRKLELTADPEFNAALRPPGRIARLKALVKGLLPIPPRSALELTPEEDEQRELDGSVDALLNRISVSNIRQSLVFRVTAETENPRKSARIADAIVDLYVLNQLEVKFEATEQATSWLTDRVAELQIELEAAEASVSEFSASTDLIDAETLQGKERQLKDLRQRIMDSRDALNAARLHAAALEALRDATPAQKAEAAGDTQLDRLLARMQDQDNAAAQQAFEARFEQVVMRAKTDQARAATQISTLELSAAALEAEIASQSEDLITLQQLTREAEANRLLYEYFLGRLKETAAQQGIQQADSRVLSNAVIPRQPSAPRKSLVLAVSGMLGLLIGSGLILALEMRATTFRTARELEGATGYTVMGQIPLLPTRRRRDALTYLSEKPTSSAAESVRNLRTSVLLSNVDNPPQVILTTSSLPGEGKTTLSLSLAQNLAGLGKKVLLIEGDIRRRVFGQYLNSDQKAGLLTVLAGDRKLEDVVLRDDRIGADVLIGEESKVNAADLFASDRFKTFLGEARTQYDMILIDTPPVLVVPDARVIAQSCDAILFAVRWDSTSKAQVEEALRMFETVGQRVTGLVLCQISPKGMKRYGHGGKYGTYSAYGAKYYTD